MKIKALVVEDDQVTLTMISRALEGKGFQVIPASDGAEAFTLAGREKPEIVISDMLLPKIDGLTLCSMIKDTPELAGIKVILMTGVYKTASVRAEAMAHKADAYLEKPVSIHNLLRVIDEVI